MKAEIEEEERTKMAIGRVKKRVSETWSRRSVVAYLLEGFLRHVASTD